MARGDIGFFKTNGNQIPAVVLAQYDSGGAVVADGAGTAAVEFVDALLLGVDQGKRYEIPRAAGEGAALPNEFWFRA